MVSAMPRIMAAISVPGRLVMPPSTQMAKARPMNSRPIDGSTDWMRISSTPATMAVATAMPKAISLVFDGTGADKAHRLRILRHREDGAAGEAPGEIELYAQQHGDAGDAGHGEAQRDLDGADLIGRGEIRQVDQAVVDAEGQHQADLDDEHDAEEEGQPLQGIVAPPFEEMVVDPVEQPPEQEAAYREQRRRQERVDAEGVDAEEGQERAEHDEGGMGDIDDVQHAEGDGHAERHGGIEAAEHDPGGHCVQQQVPAEFHIRPRFT